MNIYENSDPYDVITLAGVPSPGIVQLAGHDRTIAWDRKAGGGQDGESTTRKGVEATEFTATFSLIIDPIIGLDEETMWKEGFLPVLLATFNGTLPTAVDIYHPDLVDVGIKSVVVKKIGGIVRDGKGGAKVSVTFLEHRPAKKKSTAKPGSKTIADPKAAPDPLAAHKQQLADLLAEAQRP